MKRATDYDLICIGSGPAGQKAAIQAAKSGFRAAVIERERQVGGACVLTGTIPSKALRERAVSYQRLRGTASSLSVQLSGDAPLSALMHGVNTVVEAHDRYLSAQLQRNQIDLIRGRASIVEPTEIEVTRIDGSKVRLRTQRVLIAAGSRPRHTAYMHVDHEHVLDSDSILSLSYLPRSLLVLGSGVIACEYASIFAALGCAVTLIDKPSEPLGFLDAAVRARFTSAFESADGRYLGGVTVEDVSFDGVAQVRVRLTDGRVLEAEKVLAALGRVANIEGLGLERLDVTMTPRGHVSVNANFETSVPGIYAAGDVIGPPSLACASSVQGRQAARSALGLAPPLTADIMPTGIYTIPEIGSVGLSAGDAKAKNLDVVVGIADFSEVARAHIVGTPVGFLQLICDRGSARVLGVQAIGQAAIASGATAAYFVEQMFNFPTMAEAYRIAAFDVLKRTGYVRAEDDGRQALSA
jgi:NAD(P) transhydrogenase